MFDPASLALHKASAFTCMSWTHVEDAHVVLLTAPKPNRQVMLSICFTIFPQVNIPRWNFPYVTNPSQRTSCLLSVFVCHCQTSCTRTQYMHMWVSDWPNTAVWSQTCPPSLLVSDRTWWSLWCVPAACRFIWLLNWSKWEAVEEDKWLPFISRSTCTCWLPSCTCPQREPSVHGSCVWQPLWALRGLRDPLNHHGHSRGVNNPQCSAVMDLVQENTSMVPVYVCKTVVSWYFTKIVMNNCN